MEIIKMPPVFTAAEPEEAIRQLQRYVWQLAEQTQTALEESRRVENELAQKKQGTENTKVSAGASFRKVKDLIIKSAEIVEAYRTEITRSLYGEFVAESDFGRFEERTAQSITETNERIEQSFTAIQSIVSDVEGISSGLREMNAYIRTGFLYEEEDGSKRYGVEIGEQAEKDGVTAFKRFSRLTSDRLSFFDSNDIEVAYISDRRLFITYAQCQEVKAKKAEVQLLMVGQYVFEAGSDGHLTIS